MSGLLYKNFHTNFYSFLFTLIVTCAMGIITLVMGIVYSAKASADDMQLIMLFSILLYYLAFMMPALTSTQLFEADEGKTACAFAMSIPQGSRGHVEAKYWYMLIENLTVLFITFLFDTVVFGITGGRVTVSLVLMLIFCWRLLLSAVETPFVIRFGSQKGGAVKGLVIGLITVAVLIYLMFGDISWLLGSDDPIDALTAWLQSGSVLFPISFFPFISIGAYLLSCKISVKVFKKGAENYEQ